MPKRPQIQIVVPFRQNRSFMGFSIGNRRRNLARKIALIATLILIGVMPTFAQILKVSDRPAAIQFPDWKEVDRTLGTVEYTISFPSPVTTAYPANDHIDLRLFLPEDSESPVPVVIVLHYWGATDLKVERSLAVELAQRKIATAVMTLPFHLGRTPPGFHTGELAIEPDPDRLLATMTQSVLDVRRCVDFIESRPEFAKGKIGISGTSLGSIVSSTSFGVEPRIAFASFLLGGADIAHILWNSSRVVVQREALRRKGITENSLRKSLEPVEPLSYLHDRKDGSSFVVGGLYDTVIPHESTVALVRALPDPQVLWLDTGHYGGIFVQRRLLRLVADFFQTSFSGSKYVAPQAIYAPTLRIAFKLDSKAGFDLGLGLELLKFDRKGDAFSCIFLTPRGLQLYVGQNFALNTSVGLTLSNRGLGVGIIWSRVL